MLKNKAELWKSVDIWEFSLVKDQAFGWIYIENISKTQVLEARNDGKVTLDVKNEDVDKFPNFQLWGKSVPNNEGYFTLYNYERKVLTAISSNSFEVKGNILYFRK